MAIACIEACNVDVSSCRERELPWYATEEHKERERERGYEYRAGEIEG